ncbi:EamA family transporter [Paenibacillus sp. MBLB4367]|uniref:EamA family transporter n=1 Tax=Paenibacillus sp. MBLB4367 TaxID=3384767 RepID=UPI00390835C0
MKYMLSVFLGACSFGILSTIVKLSYGKGFTPAEAVGGQNLFGWLVLLVLMLFFSRHKIPWRTAGTLALVGMTSGLTGMFYYGSLQTVPASIAIVLLFQFTWIGVLLESVIDRKTPGTSKLASLVFLVIGTVVSSGLLNGGAFELTGKGIVLGLLSALTFSLFIFFSGRTATHVPVLTRSFWMVSGSLLLVFIVYPPVYLLDLGRLADMTPYGLPLGVFGMVIPPLFFAIGVPRIGPGLATILSAAELPTAVTLSAVVLGEQVSPLQWFGVAVILFGIAVPQMGLLLRGKTREPKGV